MRTGGGNSEAAALERTCGRGGGVCSLPSPRVRPSVAGLWLVAKIARWGVSKMKHTRAAGSRTGTVGTRHLLWWHGGACTWGKGHWRGSNSIARSGGVSFRGQGAVWRHGWGREQTSNRPNVCRVQRCGREAENAGQGTGPGGCWGREGCATSQGTGGGRAVGKTQNRLDTAWGGCENMGARGSRQDRRASAAGAVWVWCAGSRACALPTIGSLHGAAARTAQRTTAQHAQRSAAQRSLHEHIDALHGVASGFIVTGGVPHMQEGCPLLLARKEEV